MIFVIVVLLICIVQGLADPVTVSVKVINYAGEPIELFWINSFKEELEYVRQTKKPIRNSTEAVINSYDTHQFEIRFLNEGSDTAATFTKGPEDETVIVRFDESEGRLVVEQVTDLNKLFKFVEEEISKCYNNYLEDSSELSKCVSKAVLDEVYRLERTKGVMQHFQNIMGHKLREYSCKDPKLQHSTAQRSFELKFLGEAFNTSAFLDTEHAKVFTVDDFLNAEECSILRQNSRPIPNMTTHPSLTVAYNIYTKEDPLWDLFSRAVYFANYIGGYQIQLDGQESILLSKYTLGEEIKPHCDGICDGSDFNKGDYVTTVLFDCLAPISGGDIIFANANVFLPPQYGQATFITYKGKDKKMDNGFTEYSSCPVTQGERYLARLQLREGRGDVTNAPSSRTLSPPSPKNFARKVGNEDEL